MLCSSSMLQLIMIGFSLMKSLSKKARHKPPYLFRKRYFEYHMCNDFKIITYQQAKKAGYGISIINVIYQFGTCNSS